MPEQAWQRAAPRSERLSGMIKRVNRYKPHVLPIDSSAWVFTIMPYEPGPLRTAAERAEFPVAAWHAVTSCCPGPGACRSPPPVQITRDRATEAGRQ
jgi:hypothetical protein